MRCKCKRVFLREYVSTIGWGGEKTRLQLDEQDATLEVDLQSRVLTVTRHGDTLCVPLEMVRQWYPSGEADTVRRRPGRPPRAVSLGIQGQED